MMMATSTRRLLTALLVISATAATAFALPFGRKFQVKQKNPPSVSSSSSSKWKNRLFFSSKDNTPSDDTSNRRRQSGLEKYLDELFDKADTNKDGSISISETYTLVLKMYVRINREAPVKIPSQAKVDELFRTADLDRNGRLNKQEFRRLMLILYSRATTRIVSHKAVKMIVAPILALKTFKTLQGRVWVDNMATHVPGQFSGLLLNANLWRTLLTVGFVISLGNIVLSVADVFLDAVQLNKDDDKK